MSDRLGVWQLHRGSQFMWCSRLVQIDNFEERPSTRPGLWIFCHEVEGGKEHRLHYYEDEVVSIVADPEGTK